MAQVHILSHFFIAVLVDVSGAVVKLQPVAATLSNTYYCSQIRCGAFRCIDGLTNDTKENQCPTHPDPAPWLALDFGEEAQVSVEKTVLFGSVFNEDKSSRWNRNWNRSRQWHVEVWLADEIPTTALEKFSEGHLLGTFEGAATSGKEVEIQSGPGWQKKMGRYLIIQMNNVTEDIGPEGSGPLGPLDFGLRSFQLISLNLKEVFTFGTTHVPPNGMFCFVVYNIYC